MSRADFLLETHENKSEQKETIHLRMYMVSVSKAVSSLNCSCVYNDVSGKNQPPSRLYTENLRLQTCLSNFKFRE